MSAEQDREPAGRDGAARWLGSAEHRAWVTTQALELLGFFRAGIDPDGWFTELDDFGRALPTGCPPAARPQQNLLTVTRAVHCYAAGELLGVPGCHAIVELGLESLWTRHRDDTAGGYVESVAPSGPAGTHKTAYGHAHVLLAAASALAAGHPRAHDLLGDVLATIDEHFWSDADGAAGPDAYSREWVELEPYRGVNSNMHLCESLLAAAHASGRADLAERARRLALTFIDGHARRHGWLIPEHYDTTWTPRLEYNRDRPDDPFRPYGATVGHSLEWSRLLLCVGLSTGALDEPLLEMSQSLFARAVEVGWDRVHGGLAYTVGWDGRPANADHYWWPIAEGIATSSYLLRVTGLDTYEIWYRRFWEYAATWLIDHEHGGWFPIRDAENRRKVHPWYGKPDLYHCLQACLLPILPMAPSLASAITTRPAATA